MYIHVFWHSYIALYKILCDTNSCDQHLTDIIRINRLLHKIIALQYNNVTDALLACRSGDHDFIGSCTTSLREIIPEKGGEVRTLDIINPDIKKKKKKYTNSGTLNFNSVR